MTSVLIDGELLAVVLPEGFEPIPHAELESLVGFKYDRMWGVRDTERHMLLNVTWKDSSKLLLKIASERMLANRADEGFARRHRKDGYRCDGRFSRTIAGADATAHGFRFSYTIGDIGQEGEVFVFKRGKRCYTLCYYTRPEVAAENHPVYEEVVESLEVR